MTEPPVVRIADLRRALSRVLDATEALLGPEVALHADYYWHLPVDAAFDVYTEPQNLTMGQLSDDFGAVPDPSDGVPENAPHDLMHVAGILRALELAARARTS
ncbi:hypothetical protein [Kribbella sp. HUAS MG21]|uniref:Uncharacterized protein n=1 Tax=Kribbella sp. HUAS MG21 TaxID=3160966 RepID=A0AAU7TL71_9ACTN